MKLRVLLFAGLRDAHGAASLELDLPASSTVAELRDLVGERFPRLRERLAQSRVAVGHEFRPDDFAIADGSEVALIPPVSGG